MPALYRPTFSATLCGYGDTGAWVFAPVPAKYAPPVTHAWGRTPVVATVDGQTWKTSVWHTKDGRTLLAVPKKVRGAKRVGDRVAVRIEFSVL